MDSYVAVKISEALYSMKESLQSVEQQFQQVSKEKLRMEKVLRDKVQMIRVCKKISYKVVVTFLLYC